MTTTTPLSTPLPSREVVAYDGDAGTLLVAPLRRASSREGSRAWVVSSCLFMCPWRADGDPAEYAIRVESYLRGIEACVAKLRGTPWAYRLYVDHSVLRDYPPGSYIADLAAAARRRVAALRGVTLIATRFVPRGVMRHAGDGQTFLPSVWRYLPMADPKVSAFCSADADTPVSPLMLHLGEKWLQEDAAADGTQTLFVKLGNHITPQCALYVATHLDGAPSDAMCPIAKLWFWRRPPASSPDAFKGQGPQTFARLMTLAADPEVHGFFAALDRDWVYGDLHRAVTSDARIVALATRRPSGNTIVLSTVRDAVAAALARMPPDGRHDAWTRLVAGSPRLLDLAALTLCGRMVTDAAPSPAIKRLLASSFASPLKTDAHLRAMSKIVLEQGYGIDEWLLHAVLMGTRARVVGADTPEAGVTVRSRSLSGRDDAPPLIAWLQDAAVAQCSDGDRARGRGDIAEYAARACVMALLLQPAEGSLPQVERRWVAWRDDMLAHIARMAGIPGLAALLREHLLESAPGRRWLGACIHQHFDFKAPRLGQWLKERGAALHGGGGPQVRVRYAEKEDAMDAWVDVLVRALFLDLRMLHIERCLPRNASRPGPAQPVD